MIAMPTPECIKQYRQEQFELMLTYAKRRWTHGSRQTWRGRKLKVRR